MAAWFRVPLSSIEVLGDGKESSIDLGGNPSAQPPPKRGMQKGMGKMSWFLRFADERLGEGYNKRVFNVIRDSMTLSESTFCLEIGGGKGYLSYFLYEHYRPQRLVVTDYDPARVEKAIGLFEDKLKTIPANVELKVADALDLPFGDETFDAAFAMWVLHHTEAHNREFKSIPRALNEIGRVLKPNGSFAYGEFFNKEKIRSYLVGMGLREELRKRQFLVGELCIYSKMADSQL